MGSHIFVIFFFESSRAADKCYLMITGRWTHGEQIIGAEKKSDCIH